MFDYSIIEYGMDCDRRYTKDLPRLDFHLHNKYEVYFLISGDVHYFVEGKKYILQKGDTLVLNSKEIHKPTFTGDAPYERMTMHFNPRIAAHFSTPGMNLLSCFESRPNGENNLIKIDPKDQPDFEQLLNELADLHPQEGEQVEKLSLFLQIMIILNRNFRKSSLDTANNRIYQPQALKAPVSQVIAYINDHLTEDLSLETLEKVSYLNKNYLCRLFKEQMNSTIHNYIIVRRISLAKELLEDGTSVTEACSKSGFNDYANFIRMFKKVTGIPPSKYAKDMGN